MLAGIEMATRDLQISQQYRYPFIVHKQLCSRKLRVAVSVQSRKNRWCFWCWCSQNLYSKYQTPSRSSGIKQEEEEEEEEGVNNNKEEANAGTAQCAYCSD